MAGSLGWEGLYATRPSFEGMERRTKIAAAAIAVVLAFLFLVPMMQTNFVIAAPPPNCNLRSAFGCVYFAKPGHSSVTYWLFGLGATYGSVNNTGYGLGYATCSWGGMNVNLTTFLQYRTCASRLTI